MSAADDKFAEALAFFDALRTGKLDAHEEIPRRIHEFLAALLAVGVEPSLVGRLFVAEGLFCLRVHGHGRSVVFELVKRMMRIIDEKPLPPKPTTGGAS